jgi:ribosomal protein L7/L12
MRLNVNEQFKENETFPRTNAEAEAIEQTRKDQREFKETLLGELMSVSPQMKIARIKIVRSHTGLDLKRAKMVVDTINDEIPHLDLAKHSKDQETLQRLGDENSRLYGRIADAEDTLHSTQEDLRVAESTRDDISSRYAATQEILQDARSILSVISNRVTVCPTVHPLVQGLTSLLIDACEE